MSIAIHCPDCNRKYLVTEKHIGKKVVCADASCGCSFIAEKPRDAASDEFDFTYDPSDAEAVPKERPSPPPTLPKTASQSVDETEGEIDEQEEPAGNPWRKPRQSFANSPYPNLSLYLWVVALVFRVQLIICLIIGGISGVLTAVVFAQTQRFDAIAGGALVTFALIVPAIVLYVVSMAGVEFVRVIVDLRNDAKQTAEHLATLRSELAVKR